MNAPGRRRTTLFNLLTQGFLVVYAIANGVLLVPLYLEHIPSELYGAWLASGNIIGWMAAIDPGISTILQQRVAEAFGAGEKKSISGWIASGLIMSFVISAVIGVAGVGASYLLGPFMNLPSSIDLPALESAFRWSSLSSALMVFSFGFAAACQGLQSSVGYGVVVLVAMGSRLVLVVVMLEAGYGLLAIAIPNVVMGALSVIGHAINLRLRMRGAEIPASLGISHLRDLAGLMGLTSLSRIASTLAANMDLFLVARVLGPDNVNVLRFTRTVPDTTRMFVERPVNALQPALAHLLGSPEREQARQLVVRVCQLILWLMALLTGGFLAFNADFLRLWVGDEFYAGNLVNLLIAAGFIVAVTLSALSALCFTAGAIRETSLSGAAQVALYLPLVWFGAYSYGMHGVVGATIISVLLTQGIIIPRTLARRYKLERAQLVALLRSGFSGVAAAGLLVLVAHALPTPAGWVEFGGQVLLASASFAAALPALSPAARAEMGALLSQLRRLRR